MLTNLLIIAQSNRNKSEINTAMNLFAIAMSIIHVYN